MEQNQPNRITRRRFVGQASCAAVGSTAFFNSLLTLMLTGTASAHAVGQQDDYKALVCLFLPGGYDSFNVLVPSGEAGYAEYLATRSDVAIPRESLLSLSPLNSMLEMGVHPGMAELRTLFNARKAAFVANVGSLVKPTTKQDYWNGSGLPYGLFSHSDQIEQWQTSIPDSRAGLGWMGRLADLLAPSNAPSSVSMNISVAGNSLLQVGNTITPYVTNPWGAVGLDGYRDWHPSSGIITPAVDNMLAAEYQNVLQRTYNQMKRKSLDAYFEFRDATAGGLPSGVTFPDNYLGEQLKTIANVIAGRQTLGVKRQTFYVQWGGWDFHDEVLVNMSNMLPVVSKAVNAFYQAMVALGMENNVTLFTASDFGRTLTSNGRGTDHAWGGNHFVVGGGVNGGRIFGTYPSLVMDNPLDVGRGSLIPTTAVDQYAAELALWMGVPKSDLPLILPNISRFYSLTSAAKPIGFMK